MVELGRRRILPHQPAVHKGFRHVEQRLEKVELGRAQPGEVSVGEPTDQQVEFLHAAMPSTKRQALASALEIFLHRCDLPGPVGDATWYRTCLEWSHS